MLDDTTSAVIALGPVVSRDSQLGLFYSAALNVQPQKGRDMLQLISELEDAVATGSAEKRVATLRQVTDLFLNDSARLSDEQVKVFDDVLCVLVTRVESRARAELAARIATLEHAPFEVIQNLARDNEIAVAESVLTGSSLLRTSDLVEIASTKGQGHLLAISGRPNLPAAVTDVIVDRGEDNVIRKLAGNASARFSDAGYSKVVRRSEKDGELIEILGLRVDLPINYLRDLLGRATEAVRARLMTSAPPELREEIDKIVKGIAKTTRESMRDFSKAEAAVAQIEPHKFDKAIEKFANDGKFDEVAAAIARLTSAPTEMIVRLLEGARSDLVLIPCKAGNLDWALVDRILRKRPSKQNITEETLQIAEKDYLKLSTATAQRTLRFWQVHDKLEK